MKTSMLVLLVLAGCALTQKQAPLEVRYFSPESRATPTARVLPRHTIASPGSAGARSVAEGQRGETIDLQLGRVSASDYLRAPIVHRESAVEVDRYATLRWTELPDVYAERALARALFESDRPFAQVVSGSGPALEVELTAFEEVRTGGRVAGRVELRYQLRDDRVVLDRGVVSVQRDAAGANIELVVAAIGDALESATAAVADRVSARLATPRECSSCAGTAGQR